MAGSARGWVAPPSRWSGSSGSGPTGTMTGFLRAFVGVLEARAGLWGGCERLARRMVGGFLGTVCLPASLLGLAAHAAFGSASPEGGFARPLSWSVWWPAPLSRGLVALGARRAIGSMETLARRAGLAISVQDEGLVARLQDGVLRHKPRERFGPRGTAGQDEGREGRERRGEPCPGNLREAREETEGRERR